MKKILFIDDEEWRLKSGKEHGFLPAETFWAPTAADAIRMLRSDAWDVVFFDHDLAEAHYGGYACPEPTGYDVAKLFVSEIMQETPQQPTCVVHSMNSFGALRIHRVLSEAGLPTALVPFHQLVDGQVKLGLLWSE